MGIPVVPTNGTDDELLDAWVEMARKEAQKYTSSPSPSPGAGAGSAAPRIQLILTSQDGDRMLLVDLAEGLAPEQAIRRTEAQDDTAVVSLKTSMETARALASGQMGPTKAFALRKVTLERGDFGLLQRLARDYAPKAEGEEAIKPSVTVAVLSAEVEQAGGRHGVYTLLVTEGAACWVVKRRWRELRALHQALSMRHSRSESGGACIPALPRHLFPMFQGSASAAVLRKRPAQIEEWISHVLTLVTCIPESGIGAPALLDFLGAIADPRASRSSPAETFRQEMASHDTFQAPQGEDFGALQTRSHLEVQAAAVKTLTASIAQARTLAGSCVIALALAVALSQVSAFMPEEPADFAANATYGVSLGSLPIPVPLLLQAVLACALLLAGVWLLGPGVPRTLSARLSLYRRYLQVSLLFTRIVVNYTITKYLVRWFFPSRKQQLWDSMNEWLGALLYKHLMRVGGYWLKVGQYLASRSDMVPVEIIKPLSRMLDSNPTRPLSETLETLMEAWGTSAPGIIHSLISTPVSVGTIAQVHIGWLRVEGSDKGPVKVAIKVQHQDIAPILKQDLIQSFVLARVLRWFEPTMDFTGLLVELNAEHLKELDFNQEAQNLIDVRDNLSRSRAPVVVPRVISHLTSEKVLIMEFCPGDSLKDAELLTQKGIDLEQLVMRVCEVWARQMFYDGIFNGDAHAGNILVQKHPTFGAVPVLLDFGLCKRLTKVEKKGMCQLVHALEEMDGDLILESLENLGFVFQKEEMEATEVFRDLMFAFRDSEANPEAARAKVMDKVDEDMRRGDIYSKDAKKQVKQGKKAPLEALPGVIVFVFKTIEMLQGLCTRLGVSVPFLQPMGLYSRQALLNEAKETMPAQPPVRLSPQPASPLQDRVVQLLHTLAESGEVLGAQCCVMAGGRVIVDAAAGRMGPVDPRPVRPDHMFQLFEAGCPLLAALVLQLVEQERLALDRPIADVWPQFRAGGKGDITAAALLNHASGLKTVMPRRAQLKDLLDLSAMEKFLAEAEMPADEGADKADFEGAPWGWALAGLLRSTGGAVDADLATLLSQRICQPLGVDQELKLKVSTEEEHNVARHSIAGLMAELGIDMSDLSGLDDLQKSTETGDASLVDHSSGDVFANSGEDFERFQGPQQLALPSTYNMRSVRHAGVPGCAMFASARSLARFYASVGSGDRRLGLGNVVRRAEARAVDGTLLEESVRFGLGMQVGSIAERGGARRNVATLGHRGMGGTVGFCIPAGDLSVAFTCSKLSTKGAVTRRVLSLVLGACGDGWELPEGIL